jgi:hypothetical protein
MIRRPSPPRLERAGTRIGRPRGRRRSAGLSGRPRQEPAGRSTLPPRSRAFAPGRRHQAEQAAEKRAASGWVTSGSDSAAREFSTVERVGPSRVRLGEEVAALTLRAIALSDFPPGTFLPKEAELSALRNVSRAVVREGLQLLAPMGVVKALHGRGTVVLPEDDWNVLSPSSRPPSRPLAGVTACAWTFTRSGGSSNALPRRRLPRMPAQSSGARSPPAPASSWHKRSLMPVAR